jgi:hypothetical protein
VTRSHLRRLLISLALAAGAVAVPSAALAADPTTPPGTTWSEAYIPVETGVELHADIYKPNKLPPGMDKSPVIMSLGPYYGGDPTAPNPEQSHNWYYTELWKEMGVVNKGYTLIAVDLRGFGGSSGCNDFGGKGEQLDVKMAVEWAAKQPWSNGRVAIFGKSYDGWTGVMGLATKPKGLAAVVVQAPVISGYKTLYQQGNHYYVGWWATPAVYQAYDAQGASVNRSPEYMAHVALGTNPACYATNIALQNGLQNPDDAAGFWKERDLVPAARGSSIPTFWAHGFLDENAKPDHFMDIWSTLTGPKRGWYGQFFHTRLYKAKEIGHGGYSAEAARFLDRYVLGLPADQAPVENDPVVEVQSGDDGKWRAEAAWPPADSTPFSMPVKKGTYNDANDGTASWTFTQQLPYDVHVSGVTRAKLKLSSSAPRINALAYLYDVNPEGTKATLVARTGSTVAPGDVSLEFYPNDYVVRAGHRLALKVFADDESWYTPPASEQAVSVDGGSVQIPALAFKRSVFYADSKPADGMKARTPLDVTPALVKANTLESPLPPALAPMPQPPGSSANPGPQPVAPSATGGTKPGTGRRTRGSRSITSGIVGRKKLRRGRVLITIAGKAPRRTRLLVTLRSGRKLVASRRITASRTGRYRFRVTLPAAKAKRLKVSARRAR